jgi:hypothetical protein
MPPPQVAIVVTPTGLAADALLTPAPIPPLTEEQTSIVTKVLSGESRPLLVQGFAGCGKSSILRAIISKMKRVEIQTLHRLCASRAGETVSEWLLSVRFNVKDFDMCKVDLVIIDEFSMVASDSWNKLSSLLRRFKNPARPFGGIRVVAFGDACQLPPVSQMSFFKTESYQKMNFEIRCLSELHRYDTDDFESWKIFVDLLLEISVLFYKPRPLSPSVAASFDYLLCEPMRQPPDPLSALYLYATNEACHQHNLDTARKSGQKYQSVLVSSSDTMEDPLQTGIVLYPGAPVVITQNVYSGPVIVAANGAAFTFIACSGDHVKEFQQDGVLYSVFKAGPTVKVEVSGKEDAVISLVSVMPREGSSTTELLSTKATKQYVWPLKAGFARTVHNVQGMTWDGRTHIDLRGIRLGEDFPLQLLYVALTRVRSFMQVSLSGVDSGIIAAAVKRIVANDAPPCDTVQEIVQLAISSRSRWDQSVPTGAFSA